MKGGWEERAKGMRPGKVEDEFWRWTLVSEKEEREEEVVIGRGGLGP